MNKNRQRVHGFIDRGSLKVGERFTFAGEDGLIKQSTPIVDVQLHGGIGYVETENSMYYIGIDPPENEINLDAMSESLVYKSQEINEQAASVAEQILNNNDKNLVLVKDVDLNNIFVKCQDDNWYRFAPDDIHPGWNVRMDCTMVDLATGAERYGTLNIPQLESFTFDKEAGELLEFSSRSKEFVSEDVLRAMGDIQQNQSFEIENNDYQAPIIGE